MDEQAILNRIRDYQNRIDNNNTKIYKLKESCENVQQIRGKLYNSQEQLGEYRQSERNKANSMRGSFKNVKFVQLFSDVLEQAADDTDALRAEKGIYDSIDAANRRLDELSNQIDELESDNAYCSNRIDDLRYELSRNGD